MHCASHEYHDEVREMGLAQPMSGKGNCHDNACVEPFFGKMKSEPGKTGGMTLPEAEERIADYVNCYDNERCRKRLGDITQAAHAKKLEELAA